MSRVTVKPAWILASEAGDHFEPQLFRLLRALHDTGKLTLAAKERYMLICRTRALRHPSVSELVSLLKGREFASMIQSVAGYALDDPGEVVTLDNVVPWLGRPEIRHSRRSRH